MSNTKNLTWSAIDRFSNFGIGFIISIILTRLLTPYDYGLYGLLTIFVSLGSVFIDSGFTLALIQKKDRDEKDYSTVFYFNLLIALLVYLFFFFLSPFIATFYKHNVLKDVSRVLCANLILGALSNVQRIKLIVDSKFDKLAIVSIISSIVSGIVGIAVAYMGYGVWAIVVQQLLYNIIYAVVIWYVAQWYPLLSFSVASFKKMYSFGIKIFFGGVLHTIYTNIYPLLIGKMFSTIQVGYYTKANNLASLPSSLLTVTFDNIAFPQWSSIQDEKNALKKSFFTYLRIASFLVFPIMAILSVLSKPVILLLFGAQWEKAAWIMSFLCLSYSFFPIMDFNFQVLNAIGRSDLSLKSELYNKFFSVLLLFVLSYFFGIIGLCLSFILYSVFSIILSAFYMKKTTGITFVEEVREILPIILVSIIVGTIVCIVQYILKLPLFLKILICSFVGFILYIGIFRFLKSPELDSIISKIKLKFQI